MLPTGKVVSLFTWGYKSEKHSSNQRNGDTKAVGISGWLLTLTHQVLVKLPLASHKQCYQEWGLAHQDSCPHTLIPSLGPFARECDSHQEIGLSGVGETWLLPV